MAKNFMHSLLCIRSFIQSFIHAPFHSSTIIIACIHAFIHAFVHSLFIHSFINSPNRLTCMGFLLLSKGCIPGRMILPLSPGVHPTLGALGRMSLHLSPPCLPLVSHSGCLGRVSLHLSPPCLPLWVPCAP